MKLKAYTVMELMVVAMLSVLSVIAAINVMALFQQQFFSYEKDTSTALALSDIHVLLQEDFFKANRIERIGDELVFAFAKHQIHYQVTESFIVREIHTTNIKRDTISIQLESMNTFFDENEVVKGPISEANISIQYEDRFFELAFRKELDASKMINEPDGN